MKHVRGITLLRNFSIMRVWIWALVGILSLSAFPAQAADSAKQEFLQSVQSAVDHKDLKAFKQLFNWEGVPEGIRASIQKHLFDHLFDHPIESVRLAPLPKDFRTEYVVNGLRHYPNVTILGFVEIRYQKSQQGRTAVKVPYGQNGNRYWFAGTVQEKVKGNAPKSKQIQVIIVGMGHPPVTFEGFMLYLDGEKPVRKNLKDLGGGNLTQIVRGDDITFLKVWRTSPKGALRVEILIDGKTIFETGPTDTGQPIVFRK